MAFYRGQVQTAQHRANAKAARLAKYGQAKCLVCQEEFSKYAKSSVLCGKRECKNRHSSAKYRQREADDPVLARAYRLSGSVRMGTNKVPRMYEMLKKAIGQPCEYCKSVVTLENASLDHKIPRSFDKVYNRRLRKMLYTQGQIQELDREENLHIVCKTCNTQKSDLTHDQYLTLLAFLNEHPDIKANILTRFNRATLVFKRYF